MKLKQTVEAVVDKNGLVVADYTCDGVQIRGIDERRTESPEDWWSIDFLDAKTPDSAPHTVKRVVIIEADEYERLKEIAVIHGVRKRK